MEMGYPPPPSDGQSENITFRHPSDAGGKYLRIVLLLAKQIYVLKIIFEGNHLAVQPVSHFRMESPSLLVSN